MTKLLARFVNTSEQVLVENDVILFNSNTISSKYIKYKDGKIQLLQPGTYKIMANFTGVAVSAAVSIKMLENGSNVPGAEGRSSAAGSGPENVAFNALTTVVRTCQDEYATITFVAMDEEAISLANVIIEKVD